MKARDGRGPRSRVSRLRRSTLARARIPLAKSEEKGVLLTVSETQRLAEDILPRLWILLNYTARKCGTETIQHVTLHFRTVTEIAPKSL